MAPSGGQKDASSPVVVSVFPQEKSTLFPLSGQEITFVFDEFVQLKDPQKTIIMSPPPRLSPVFVVNGKVLTVLFGESLLRNTTYSINFSGAVSDIHENNAIDDLNFSFSTGGFIDSNSVSGFLKNAFTAMPVGGALVSLWPNRGFCDSTLFQTKPSYYTKTAADGRFQIKNLPSDNFRLFAYKKTSAGLSYSVGDSLAIFTNPILVSGDFDVGDLFIFAPQRAQPNQLLSATSQGPGCFCLAFYRPENLGVSVVGGGAYLSNKKTGAFGVDSFYFFSDSSTKDSVCFKISTPDTSYVFFVAQQKKIKRPGFTLVGAAATELSDTIIIELSAPKSIFNNRLVFFNEDSLETQPLFFGFDGDSRLKLFHPWKEKTNYSLVFKDSALLDVFGRHSPALEIRFKSKGIKDYGSLVLNIEKTPSGATYILQLTKRNVVVKEALINGSKNLVFNYLSPGEYRVKLIKDDNKNGVWDTGDLKNGLFPERCYIYNQPFNIRAFWDLEQSVDLDMLLNTR